MARHRPSIEKPEGRGFESRPRYSKEAPQIAGFLFGPFAAIGPFGCALAPDSPALADA